MNQRLEAKVEKLEHANELYKLKQDANKNTIKQLKLELQECRQELQTEIDEREKSILNSDASRLMKELHAERAVRLQELEQTQLKDREIKALAAEASIVTKGALQAQQEAAEKRAEIIALRKTLECSSKLVRVAEYDYMTTHKELENTKLQLLEARRQYIATKEDATLWIDRYQQAMIDLHVAQLKLSQAATGNSGKQSAQMRGYGVVLSESGGEPISLGHSSVLYTAKQRSTKISNGTQNDLALRKHQNSRIQNRVKQPTAASHMRSISLLRSSDAVSTPLLEPLHAYQSNRHRGEQRSAPAARTAADQYFEKEFGVTAVPTPSSTLQKASKHASRKYETNARSHHDSVRSKFIGRGLGVIKSNPVPSPKPSPRLPPH